jgi:hypothetical protein
MLYFYKSYTSDIYQLNCPTEAVIILIEIRSNYTQVLVHDFHYTINSFQQILKKKKTYINSSRIASSFTIS